MQEVIIDYKIYRKLYQLGDFVRISEVISNLQLLFSIILQYSLYQFSAANFSEFSYWKLPEVFAITVLRFIKK